MMDEIRDDELVRLAQSGDKSAFGRLYDRTARLVRAVAADAGTSAIDDVTHDTFLRAYLKLSTLRDPASFSPWLIAIARLVVRERKRSKKHETISKNVPGPSETWTDETEFLLQLVARLPEDERLAIRLFFLSEQGIDETSRLLGRSRSGTYALIQSAKQKLARWLVACEVQP